MGNTAGWISVSLTTSCCIPAFESWLRWQCLPLLEKSGGYEMQRFFVFFFDWPRFEALQNKNTQLLLVLTDDWISKLIILQGIYGFLCISVVFSCPLCLSLSLRKACKIFLPLNLLPLCYVFIKGLLKTRGAKMINTSHTFIIKHMFKNFGNIMLQQPLVFLFSGNCIWTKKGRISHCLRFCSPSTRHWRSPEMSLLKWWDILV